MNPIDKTWPDERAQSLKQFVEIVQSHLRADRPFGWTGRARPGWRLESTLDRFLRKVARYESIPHWLKREEAMILKFRATAGRYASAAEARLLQGEARLPALAFARHAGLPTRLLDWTRSPWVAAFFACHDVDHADADGVIWWFDFDRLENEVGKHWDQFGVPYLNRAPEFDALDELERRKRNCAQDLERDLEQVTFLAPGAPWISKWHVFPSARMEAQQAFHTFSGQLGLNHEAAIDELASRSQGRAIPRGRISIAAQVKPEVFAYLQGAAITAETLHYPGADIVARSLAEVPAVALAANTSRMVPSS